MPWYSAFGNHDGLVQGNFPQPLQLSLVSTGALKLFSLPASLSAAEVLNSLQSGDLARLLQSLALTPPYERYPPTSTGGCSPAIRSWSSTSRRAAHRSVTASPPRTARRARRTTSSTKATAGSS